jgi:homoserine acetyltransferase
LNTIGASRCDRVSLKTKALAVGGVALGVLAVVLGLRWLLAHLAYEQQLAQCQALRTQLSQTKTRLDVTTRDMRQARLNAEQAKLLRSTDPAAYINYSEKVATKVDAVADVGEQLVKLSSDYQAARCLDVVR